MSNKDILHNFSEEKRCFRSSLCKRDTDQLDVINPWDFCTNLELEHVISSPYRTVCFYFVTFDMLFTSGLDFSQLSQCPCL